MTYKSMRLARNTRDYFKTSAIVMADQLLNGIYGLNAVKLNTKVKGTKDVPGLENTHPRLTKATRIITNGVFWTAMAMFGKQLSDYLGKKFENSISSQTIRDVVSQTIGYTSLSIHPMLVSLAKNISNFRKGVDEMLKPGIRSYAAAFTLVGPVGNLLFMTAMTSITNCATGTVGLFRATASVTLAWLAMVAFEYPAFKAIWERLVLHNMEKGTWKDVFNGFAKTFDAKALFHDQKKCDIPKTAGGFVGQLFGISQSYYWTLLPVRIIIVGAISALYALSPKDFVNEFMLLSGMVIGVLDPFLAGFTTTRAQSRIEEIEKQRNDSSVI